MGEQFKAIVIIARWIGLLSTDFISMLVEWTLTSFYLKICILLKKVKQGETAVKY